MCVFEVEILQCGLIEVVICKFDFVIFDFGLLDGDGIDFICDLCQWSQMLIIVLLVCSEEYDKIVVLDVGVDDYLSKFFGIGELQVCLCVVLCCYGVVQVDELVVCFVDLEVNIFVCCILCGSEEIYLMFIEFCLLVVLLNNFGKVFIQCQLLNQVWGFNVVEYSYYLWIYMGYL